MMSTQLHNPPAELAARFERLAAAWREKSKYFSSDHDMAMLPEYQSIIGMGPAAIPLLLRALEERTDHWFWALAAITGENPTSPASRGKVELLRQDWLRWGRAHGYL